MSTRRLQPLRRRYPVLLPLLIVGLSGLLGMLLARRFLRQEIPARVDAQTRATVRERETGTAAAETPAAAQIQPPSIAAPDQAATEGLTGTDAGAKTPGAITEDREIDLVLHRWVTALLSNSSQQIAQSYASHMDRYFLQTYVSRSYVQAYLQGEESRGWRLTAYDVRHVRIQHVSRNEVDVEFVAGYAVTTGTGGRAGSAHTLLKLRPEDGDWKIFFERDLSS